MDPSLWGPHYWFFLHTMAFNYPKYPTPMQRKIHYRFIQHLPDMIPNKQMASQFIKLTEQFPVEPYLDTQEDFIKWMHFIHNHINRLIDKPQISLSQHYTTMKELYLPKHTRFQLYVKNKYSLVITLFILMILAFIYHLSREKLPFMKYWNFLTMYLYYPFQSIP